MAQKQQMEIVKPNNTFMQEEQERDIDRQKYQKQQNEQRFNARLDELAIVADRMERERGAEDHLTVLMQAFLEVALELQDMMQSINSISTAMECLSDAINFIDDAINFDKLLFQQSAAEKHGWFARQKSRRLMRKAIRNNTGRMYELAESMVYKYKMVIGLSDAMQDACYKMKTVMGKQAEKRKKKLAEMPSAEPAAKSARMKKFIHSVKVKKGLADEDDAPAAPTAPAASSGGIDDIIS
jgi:hypothetical protein